MESGKNFKPHISAEDAINICYKYATTGVMYDAYDCYCKAYDQCKPDNDIIWKQHSGLAVVYIMGFISGSRAVRERKRNKTIAKM
ncbi:MAG: hypothetical protein K2L19_03835 [Eubacterium sp.]|nr:hypothetical protein [Eubacterium sp.]